MAKQQPAPDPTHHPGTGQGEEMIEDSGRAPGRIHHVRRTRTRRPMGQATARDATGINAEAREPIHPDSVFLPPA